ncbi:hypothetical protein PVAND_004322 [Polypedilum vanderplanki]|uniref:Uncharacterized protein n=1 Tax=Polypedilum vanderplanki TaxID=319348 RepID=A0A9J6BXS3_POLVA|nr:hypothetical protein PVAND_004322 [Polypedilum vanderplanki]
MGLPTFQKFCCCCNLEFGGLVIGWFNAVVSFIGFLGAIGMIFIGSTAVLVSSNPTELTNALSFLVVGCIYVIYFLIYFIAAINLIMAVNRREPERMKLMMILMIVGVFISFISIWTSLWSGLASAIIYSCIQVYFFLCIYSFYKMLKNERGDQVQQPMPYA